MDRAYRIVIEILPRFLKEPWIREVEIPENYSLHEIHLYIQNLIGFDNDHMYDFYGSINGFKQLIHYSDEELFEFIVEDFEEIELKDVFPLKRRRMNLYYLFDYGDSWIFAFRRPRRIKMIDEVIYPSIIRSVGANPEQYVYEP